MWVVSTLCSAYGFRLSGEAGWARVAFGKVLRVLRKQAGYSTEQLALDADLQRNYISLLERGANSTSIELYKLASVLNTSPAKMLEQADLVVQRGR